MGLNFHDDHPLPPSLPMIALQSQHACLCQGLRQNHNP